VPTSADAGRVLLDGGTLRTTADLTIAANRGITVGASNGGIEVDTATTAALDSIITGSGTLTKSGAGTLLVNSDSSASFSGITQVSAGTLQIASSAATGSGDLVVNGATSTVSGTGSVSGNTSVLLGTVAPGDPGTANGIGTLTLAGATSDLTAGSILDLQITHSNGLGTLGTNLDGSGNIDWAVIESASRNAGTADILDISGTMNLVTGAIIKLSSADSGTFEKGMAWDLLDWGTLGTSPTSLIFEYDSALASELVTAGLAFDTSRFASHGIIAIVPEPGRMSLIGLGMAAALLRRRRRSAM